MLTLRYMRHADISQVLEIDRVAFSTPWSSSSYAYEIRDSTYSYMVVLEHSDERPVQGLRRLIRQFNGHPSATETVQHVVSYGGLWSIADEAHISTIATHPDWRRNGYGELLLAAMIEKAHLLESSYIVLEVRVSNTAAQQLYYKYDFEIYGTKNKYYYDNGEDAYDMRLDLENPQIIQRFEVRYAELRRHYDYLDQFTHHPRPGVRV